MYHGFARSAGMTYREALGYTFAGGIAGRFFGESLFRMASQVLEKETTLPPFRRLTGAAAMPPATGFDRPAFGKRFNAVCDSPAPAYYSRLEPGAVGTSQTFPGQFRNGLRGARKRCRQHHGPRPAVRCDDEPGRNCRALRRRYGSYDTVAPRRFRVSSTALSLSRTHDGG